MPAPTLILASTSAYRRQLLDRLLIPFDAQAPDVDESGRDGETPGELCVRLADDKAQAVAAQHRQAWVIGADQVAERDGLAIGKPGNHERAFAQLRAASAQEVRFHTAVCVRHEASGTAMTHCDLTIVRFRDLDDACIARYLCAERPYDCAGSFKSEGLGIGLFDAIHSQDPTALIGLPLIALARMLRQAGFAVP